MLVRFKRRIVLVLAAGGSIDVHAMLPCPQRTECEETCAVPVEKADKSSLDWEPFATYGGWFGVPALRKMA